MFKSYLTIAIRSSLRQRFHAAINVLGLAIGMTCVILIAMYIRWELGFNTQFPNTENLYRVIRSTVGNENQLLYTTRTSGALAGVLRNEYPEVLDVTRLLRREVFVSSGDKVLSQIFCLADDNVLDTFPHVFARSDAATLVRSPGSLVVSQTLAQKLFEDRDPIGQTLRIEGTGLSADYRVCGVFFKPNNSTIQFDLLATQSSAARIHHHWANWRARGYCFIETFVRAREGVVIAAFEKNIQRIFTQYMDKEVAARNAYHLQPFNQIYLYSSQMYNIRRPGGGLPFDYGDINRLYFAGLISSFLLVIACFNFVNLSTGRATLRAKEIGVRKVVGAHPNNLVAQFLTESILISIIALLLAFCFSRFLFGTFSNLLQVQMEILFDTAFWAISFSAAVFIGLLSGLYPAFVLSTFKPISVLKSKTTSASSGFFRQILVVFQFTVSIVFISLTLVIADQMKLIAEKDLGYRREGIISLPIFNIANKSNLWGNFAGELKLQNDRVKTRFLEHPNVLDASVSRFTVAARNRQAFRFPETTLPDQQLRFMGIDDRFLRLLDIPILEGRTFPPTFIDQWDENKEMEFIVSKSLVKKMNWKEPIGKIVEWPFYNKRGPIVGVVGDIHFGSLHDQTEPIIFVPELWNLKHLYVRVNLENLPETIAFLEEAWATFLPDHPFQYTFVDEEIALWYQGEARQQKLVVVFSVLAVLIASFGLLGLVSFSVARRTKEIGIRKVLGASSYHLLTLLTKEYIVLILIANFVAWPIGFYMAQTWLASFTYRIDLGVGTFALAGFVALVIALITVFLHTLKAVQTNPVETLRME